ncbi:dynein light intermediate chain family protein [Streptomyces calvus]|uniref:BlaI/MecI/CopY family transcriptional regulator n=1 Tax=Streptomyces calvus TaxID=67282 RepID=A0A514JJC5_9ACTN|nr:hypothetical protein [Streptomyces calvus]QDI67415.1 hypothetical protein CD934_01035 [Streptomyces calvus]
MVSVSRAAHDVEITAESLQRDLVRLETQKQALERELAAVAAHLSSVRRALGAFEALMRVPAATPAASVPARQVTEPPAAPAGGVTGTAVRVPRPAGRPGGRAPAGAGDGPRTYGRLTEQVLEYLATTGDTDVRARDVAAALGRDTDSGSINAVRSTLDRLVGTSRVDRTGRGLYRAKRSRTSTGSPRG